MLPPEQQPGQLAEQGFEHRCRDWQYRRAMQAAAKAARELDVANRGRRTGIVRPACRRLAQKKINQGDLVFDMNPRHPLPTIADAPAQTKPEWRQQPLEKAAVTRQHQPRSEEHTSELQSLMRTSYAVFC